MAGKEPLISEQENNEYFNGSRHRGEKAFDVRVLREPLMSLPSRKPLVFSPRESVTDTMRAMQRENHGCVLVTPDGTPQSELVGIFTERDVLFRIIDRGRNPATLPLQEVMKPDPDSLPSDGNVAMVINKMSVYGYRYIPAVDREGRPALVISVRDVVQYLVHRFPNEILSLPFE